MKKKEILFIITLFVTLLITSCKNTKEEDSQTGVLDYPVSHQEDVIDNYFGIDINDSYRWLEEEDSETTKQWIQKQNDLTETYLKRIPYRERIKERLLKIWDYPKATAPVKIGDKYFIFRNYGLQDRSVLYYMDTLGGKEVELLDPNKFSKDKTIIISTISISEDSKHLSYNSLSKNEDIYEIYIKDINTQVVLDDCIRLTNQTHISWVEQGFYYTSLSEAKTIKDIYEKNENCRLYFHKIGTPQSEDELIYESAKNSDIILDIDISKDKKELYIYPRGREIGNALYIINLNSKKKEVKKIVSNYENDYQILDKKGDNILVLTNYKAPRYRVVEIDTRNPNPKQWRDFIPQQEGVIESVRQIKDKYIVTLIQDAYSVVKIYNEKGEFMYNLDNEEIGTISGFFCISKDNTTFYTFSSFTTPAKIYKYNVETNRSEIYETSKIDFESKDYITKQVFYTSKDSTQIPMFITHKKNIVLDGNNPTLLSGFGGFNLTLSPHFNPSHLIWLEQGGIIATPNLRGGGEYGENWHKDGILLNKQNVFDDFIAGAEYLISEKYTSKQRLAIQGGSNGGLLIGAVTNQRPDLFAVALPAVSVMDMLRYHKLSVGRYWACEYGICEESKEMFDCLYKYSPLHNIQPASQYPAILVTTSDQDYRVAPAHSYKYIAKLQNSDIGDKPRLIRIKQETQDDKLKSVEKSINEIRDIYAFAFYNLNFTPIY